VSFYPGDLARIHDEGFGDFGRAAAAEALRRLPPAGLVVELGCGTGITSQILSDAGREVLGIDIAPDVLALARRRAPRSTFREGSIWDARLPPCAGVTAIGEVINYAADERAGRGRLPGLFARVREALVAGGVFLFDFATPGRGTLREDGPQVAEGEGWWIESEAQEDEARRTLERRMRLEIDGRRRTEVHLLHLYERDEVRGELEAAGLEPESLDRYGDFLFWPGYAAFAAVKPL
jgi:SAM-dependent methyltransferase